MKRKVITEYEEVETRKVQRVFEGCYSIYLPRKYSKDNNITKGTVMRLKVDGDRITFYPYDPENEKNDSKE